MILYTRILDRTKFVFSSPASVCQGYLICQGCLKCQFHLAKYQWRRVRSDSSETTRNFGKSRNLGQSTFGLSRVGVYNHDTIRSLPPQSYNSTTCLVHRCTEQHHRTSSSAIQLRAVNMSSAGHSRYARSLSARQIAAGSFVYLQDLRSMSGCEPLIAAAAMSVLSRRL